MGEERITISDVAEALGVSKTTVSRAISGKGRIGDSTKQRVLAYIEEFGYKPNVIAKGLAQSKTFNLCVVMQEDYMLVDLPYFQETIAGIQEIAGLHEYDILLCLCKETDISGLDRVISNHKVDGVILLRTFMKDLQIEFLNRTTLPFVTVGSTLYKKVRQVDNDHQSACRELTSILLMRGMHKIALFGGAESYVVTQSRLLGYHEAFANMLIDEEPELFFLNLESYAAIEKAVASTLEKKADCILCMDDNICSQVLRILRMQLRRVPEDIRLASFYNSSVLENSIPSITSLSFNARELGREACKNLLAQIDGAEVPERTLLSYEVVLKESTK
ncbi:MAG: LacI family transcriptional regulator [Muribaculaceae bacterium]|nr:LacI family transcriptional regulator [Roseburia sp.]MCM1431730.1 LacI family transcriptional regulator [Muribaculaceae bacterium]MCM1493403.1 LacI family transcriptional regulator [Muribaculaceae bacterium]